MFVRKGCLFFLGVLVIFLLLVIMIANYDTVKNKVRHYTSFLLSEEKQFQVFEESLIKDDGFFDQVSGRVREQGYEHFMHGLIYSINDVRVEFVLTNQEVHGEVRREIEAVFNESVLKYNMDPAIFEVKIRSE